jgi:hypothetical protein
VSSIAKLGISVVFVVRGTYFGHGPYLGLRGSTSGTTLGKNMHQIGFSISVSLFFGLKADLKAIVATKSYSWVSNNPKIWENPPMPQTNEIWLKNGRRAFGDFPQYLNA